MKSQVMHRIVVADQPAERSAKKHSHDVPSPRGGVDHDFQPSVVGPRARREHQGAAVRGYVGDLHPRRSFGDLHSVELHADPGHVELHDALEPPKSILPLMDGTGSLGVEFVDDIGIIPDGEEEEELSSAAAFDGQIPYFLAACAEDGRKGVDVMRKMQLLGEGIAGSRRDQAEYGERLGQTVENLVDGAVASYGDDRVRAALRGQSSGVPRGLRLDDLDVESLGAKAFEHQPRAMTGAAPAGNRVDDRSEVPWHGGILSGRRTCFHLFGVPIIASPLMIRKLKSQEEYLAAEDVQRTVWHFPEREVIPLNELVVAQKNGGHVFGAFDRGRMIAFCFGVPGFRDGKMYHYSRMLGVLPEYQNRGLGRRMKLRQREFVLEQGLDLVRWTFDPLQGRNAHLNLEKLGCIVREYVVNIYGQSGSRFNRGLPTDRFVTEWWIRSRRATNRIAGRGSPTLEEAMTNYEPAAEGRRAKSRRVSVEIPADIDRIKENNPEEAVGWRLRTRGFFQDLFSRGYILCGFATGLEVGRRRSLYLLEKGYKIR